jgi:hypothetical protein
MPDSAHVLDSERNRDAEKALTFGLDQVDPGFYSENPPAGRR